MKPPRLIFAFTIALAACSAEDESLGRKAGAVSSDGAALSCTTPNPQGCKCGGCPSGQYCYATPAPSEAGPPICAPSSCSCNARTGTWDCTLDCNGGICRYPDDAVSPPRGDAGRC